MREFLPPDPLGGMQSGFARQFNLKDAFQVYLGGHLVHCLKFNVVQARAILKDLSPWLNRNRFFELVAGNGGQSKQEPGVEHRIYVINGENSAFCYVIRSVKTSDYRNEKENSTETYTLSLINTPDDPLAGGRVSSSRVIGISQLYRDFLRQINPTS